MMNLDNPVITLCVKITQAEFAGQHDEARNLAQQAWETVTNDYEACIAAHYVARFQTEPRQIFRWNQLALALANACEPEQVQAFYPSLYVNMGQAHEKLGNLVAAQKYYALAAELGIQHQE